MGWQDHRMICIALIAVGVGVLAAFGKAFGEGKRR